MQSMKISRMTNLMKSKKDLRTHLHVYHRRTQKRLVIRASPCKDCKIPLTRKLALDHTRIEHGIPHACPFCDFTVKDMDLSNINDLLVDSVATGRPLSGS